MSEESSGPASAATLGAIDVGSNTIHLVVARPTADGNDLRYLDDQVELVRLGADVSASGGIGTARMARAVETVRQQAERARTLGASVILGLATEGVRAATNGAELIERIREETGVALALVTGEQEAALTYWGASSGRDTIGTAGRDEDEDEGEATGSAGSQSPGEDGSERRAVVDLGGGSLELVVGEGTAVRWRVSLPLGSGTVHDRYAASDPPAAELEAARAVVAEELARLAPPLPVARAIVCGGTATTLAILTSRALLADQEKGTWVRSLDEGRMADLLALVQREPAGEIAGRYGIELGRARLLGAGCVVLREAMRRLGTDRLEVSGRGIREGALLAYVHAGEGWLAAAERGAGW